MPEHEDTGNPNVFTIFQGKYGITPAEGCALANDSAMLTTMCIVEIMGDAELTAYVDGSVFATLHEECWPESEVHMPVYFNDTLVKLIIATSGEMSLSGASGDGTVHLEGLCFSNCDRWY